MKNSHLITEEAHKLLSRGATYKMVVILLEEKLQASVTLHLSGTIAPQGVNSAILFVYRTEYAYGKELESFQKNFLGPFSTG